MHSANAAPVRISRKRIGLQLRCQRPNPPNSRLIESVSVVAHSDVAGRCYGSGHIDDVAVVWQSQRWLTLEQLTVIPASRTRLSTVKCLSAKLATYPTLGQRADSNVWFRSACPPRRLSCCSFPRPCIPAERVPRSADTGYWPRWSQTCRRCCIPLVGGAELVSI